MKLNISLSVIVPIYNVEQQISRCIESILNQQYNNLEVLLIDDGSTDQSGEIAKKYSDKYENVHYYLKENGGLSDARNFGLDIANGEAIIFVDSDDSLIEGRLSVIMNMFFNENLDVLIANAIKVTGDRQYFMRKDSTTNNIVSGMELLFNAQSRNEYNPAVWMNVYKTDFIKNNNLYFKKGILHEDEEWFPRVLLNAKKVKTTSIAFYWYMIRENSITTKKNNIENAKSKLYIAQYLHEYYSALYLKRNYKNTFDNYLADMIISTSEFINKDWELYSEMIDKKFLFSLAHSFKTRIKSIIFIISPKLYKCIRETLMSIIFDVRNTGGKRFK